MSRFERLWFDHAEQMILVVDPENLRLVRVNRLTVQRLGYTEHELLEKTILDLECALQDFFYWEEVRQGFASNVEGQEGLYRCADGSMKKAVKSIQRVEQDGKPWLLIQAREVHDELHLEEDLAQANSQLRATLESTGNGILVIDWQGRIVNMNRLLSTMWQIPEELLLSQDDGAILGHLIAQVEDGHSFHARLHQIVEAQETEELFRLRDGRIFECKSLPQELDGRIIGRVFGFNDITQRKCAEEQLQLAASVFTHAREGIMIVGADLAIMEVNDAFSRITGYSRDEVIGRNPRFLNTGLHEKGYYAAPWRELNEKGHWCGEVLSRRKNGEVYTQLQTISAVCDARGKVRSYVALFSDITPLKEHARQLEQIAHYDALTNLPNRILFADRLHQAMVQAVRRGKGIAVVYIDLDGFKAINDTYGHEAGDQLLIGAARHMKQGLREGDTIARLGGDEFVAVLIDLDDTDARQATLHRLLAAAAQAVYTNGSLLHVSASVGVTFYPQAQDIEADQLLRQADQAMYQAKLAGKNRYHFFTPALPPSAD